MRRTILALLSLLAITPALAPAWGHPMPSSAVELRLGRTGIDAELTLPVSELALGWDKPLPRDAVKAVQEYGADLKGYVRAHVRPVAPDGRPWTVTIREVAPVVEQIPDVQVALRMTPPAGAPTDRLTLNYDVIFHRLITHTAIVSLASDWNGGVLGSKPVLLGTLRDTNTSLQIDRSGGTWFQGFAATFRLGARHIAEGTDHLLFLLALLLPAPLLAAGWRWSGYAGTKTALRRVFKVVTAFTVGHSITLLFGALGWVHLPSAFIESAIALSILVSAIHALVPIFRGREIYLAGGFGLVHGLAFASTLTSFGFDPLTMISSVLGFNLGIEVFQLGVVLITMPWLILLARTRLYMPIRVIGACLTGIAATAWFLERALGWHNPIDPVVEKVAANGLWLVAGLAALSLAVTLALALKSKRPSSGGKIVAPADLDLAVVERCG